MTCLQTPSRSRVARRVGARSSAARTAAAATAAVLLVMTPVAGVGAQPAGSGDDVHLVSVQFDVAPDGGDGGGPLSAAPTSAPVRYATVQVEHQGASQRLQPLAGLVQVSLSAGDAEVVAAEVDGLRVGSSAEGYGDSLADSLVSPDLPRFARIDVGPFDPGVAIDVTFDQPLGADHYVLVQEAGGDAAVEIEALVGDGEATGRIHRVVAPYQWNTGYQAESGVDQWASVIALPVPGGGRAVTGLRIRAAQAEVKVVVLEPATGSPLAGAEATTTSTGDDGDAGDNGGQNTTDAAVGQEPGETGNPDDTVDTDDTDDIPADGAVPTEQPTKKLTELPHRPQIEVTAAVTEAVAAGGAGCDAALTAGETGSNQPVGSRAATFCFEVVNSGEVDVTDVSITDPRAGLTEARLPQASGPETLAPGDRAVFYHHTTPVGGLGEVTVRAAAQAAGTSVGASTTGADLPLTEDENEVPMVQALGMADAAPQAQQAGDETSTDSPDSLAMTGVPTEPWVLVGLATGLIFFGYTALAAFRRPGSHGAIPGQANGHDQLDALGFE